MVVFLSNFLNIYLSFLIVNKKYKQFRTNFVEIIKQLVTQNCNYFVRGRCSVTCEYL